MSLYNGVEQLSAVIGARLYQHVFERQLEPLLRLAAMSFMLCLALAPLLRLRRLERDPLQSEDLAIAAIAKP